MNTHVRHFTMVEEGALRRRIEAAIESMLALLDQLDGDADFEPSLGSNSHVDDPAMVDLEGDEVELFEGCDDEDVEDDDPGGGDVVDEPHDDSGTFDGIIADRDAAELLSDELAFQAMMDATASERFCAHEQARRQLAPIAARRQRRMTRSYWSAISAIR